MLCGGEPILPMHVVQPSDICRTHALSETDTLASVSPLGSAIFIRGAYGAGKGRTVVTTNCKATWGPEDSNRICQWPTRDDRHTNTTAVLVLTIGGRCLRAPTHTPRSTAQPGTSSLIMTYIQGVTPLRSARTTPSRVDHLQGSCRCPLAASFGRPSRQIDSCA